MPKQKYNDIKQGLKDIFTEMSAPGKQTLFSEQQKRLLNNTRRQNREQRFFRSVKFAVAASFVFLFFSILHRFNPKAQEHFKKPAQCINQLQKELPLHNMFAQLKTSSKSRRTQ